MSLAWEPIYINLKKKKIVNITSMHTRYCSNTIQLVVLFSAPHSPVKDSKPQQQLGQKQRDAFEAFQEKTSDAWDDADDDLILMANVKMSLKDVHTTAMQVGMNRFEFHKVGWGQFLVLRTINSN